MAEKTKMFIVGAGKGGKALIELFSESETIDIIGVVDINQDAPGIKLAKELNIPTASDYKEFIDKKGLNQIFNSTGSDKVQEELIKAKPGGVEVIGSHSAKLMWELIEERKKAEEGLKEKDRIIESIIQHSAVATFVVDSGHKVVYWNAACEKLTGMKAADLIGTSDHWKAFYDHQRPCVSDIIIDSKFSDMDKLYGVYTRSVLVPNGLRAEGWYPKLGGKDRYIVFDATPIYDPSGKLIAAIETLQDITEHKKTEEKLQGAYVRLYETQNQLIQAEKLNAIGKLASGVAHEVKNPLGVILQGVNYLENKISEKGENISEILIMLKESVKRADKIINDLLDFSKAANLSLQPEDINSILESSLSLVKARFKFENVDVILETKKDIPLVLGDKNKLEQVFINILLNASQAMPEGGKIIIRSYDKQLKEIRNGVGKRGTDNFKIGERAVIVEIEDTGVGIPEENLKKVFDPFFTTNGSKGGSGLGLSISCNIIDIHKGLIWIESQVGKGTKIIIILKIAKGQ